MNDPIFPLEWFRQLAARRIPVRLLNNYKGMPISNDAEIERIDEAGVVLSSHRYQIACLYLARQTYIQLEAFQISLYARVAGIQLSKQKALLADFEILRGRYCNRAQIRVEPEVAVLAEMRTRGGGDQVLASLVDLSTQGLGILLERGLYHPRDFSPGEEIVLRFRLPVTTQKVSRLTAPLSPSLDLDERFSREKMRGIPQSENPNNRNTAPLKTPPPDGLMNMRGIIRNIRPGLSANRYRIGVLITGLDDHGRLTLYQYVASRQSELIRELNALYEGLARMGSQSFR
ncbi:MAG: PilZ domain-containing protein [Bellilinea sp.]